MQAFDPKTDYYEILQVHPRAHQEVVKRAYHTLLGMLHGHPDLGGSHEFAVHLTEAYRVLGDPATRQAYDHARRVRQPALPAARPAPEASQREREGIPVAGELVVCPCCGAQNPVPLRAHHRRMYCGRCHTPLPKHAARRWPRHPLRWVFAFFGHK